MKIILLHILLLSSLLAVSYCNASQSKVYHSNNQLRDLTSGSIQEANSMISDAFVRRFLMRDENEKCVSCIKSEMKYCAVGESANKCCNITDFSPHCRYNCSNQL